MTGKYCTLQVFLGLDKINKWLPPSLINSVLYCVVLFGAVCPGAPVSPIAVSDIPPTAYLSWSPPSASGWSFTYEVTWTNGIIIVPKQASTTAEIPGLQAETQYSVVITAFPDSTVCPSQSVNFTFMTRQS